MTVAEDYPYRRWQRGASAPNPAVDLDERHVADAEHTRADVSKAAELLGYEPTHDIPEGVRQFVDWYRANRDWYEPLVRSS